MRFERKTVTDTLRWSGLALHAGTPVEVAVHPGAQGIWFRCGTERVQAIPENVTDTARSTRIGGIATIEHLMSALAAVGITDAEVELSGPEMPALDGASAQYFDLLAQAPLSVTGVVEREGLFARIFEQGERHSIAIARGTGWFRYTFESGARWPGTQDFEIHLEPQTYGQEIAPARTFAFEEEVEMLRANGMGKGLDESNALVLGQQGYVNHAKFPDEPARHKILDLIGDLYLAGIPPYLLSVVAERSGHTSNVAAAHKLRDSIRP